MKLGSITCVGTGMTLGSHMCPLSRSHIEQADVVFIGASNHLVELWIQEINPNCISLQPLYQAGKDRRKTYQEMVATMLTEVRNNRTVVGAFYGHPGVFAWAPHEVIRQARAEGFEARMEPGISAEDCLYADLNIDPGATGITHFETSQFMFYERQFDPSAYLVLWQVSIAGDKTMAQFHGSVTGLSLLVEKLTKTYLADHQVILYECPTLPIDRPRIEHCKLIELTQCSLSQHTTLVIPPSSLLKPDKWFENKMTNQ